MQLSEKMKKNLTMALGAVVVLVCAVWFLMNPGPEHIEDTNGPDNYTLQRITEADVVALKMGSRGSLSTSETHWDFGALSVSSGVEYSCKKFTGVLLLDSCTIFKGSDIHVLLPEYRVKGGNFAFYVVFDGQVIGKVEDDGFGNGEFLKENIDKTGSLQYIIAGESANFSFIAPDDWENGLRP